MDRHNIAIVRATNAVPFNGKVSSVKDVPFIKKEKGTAFAGEFFSLLRRKGLLNSIDWESPEEERNIVEQKNKEILDQYMPYTSVYNSMVLWSLNGLVPDDAYNKFSEKTCAIIDGLEEQMERSEIVSLVPTDTAIKCKDGENVELSENATVLIAKGRYERLSPEEKEQLSKLDLTVRVFDGDLKTAINTNLVESGRFTAEALSLVSEGGGYKESATSDEVMQTINSIAKENNIPQLLHDKIFRGETGEEEKLEDVKGEYEQCNVVSAFYKQAFFEYLFSKMDIDDGVKAYALYSPDSANCMENLCDEISRIGIDKYKAILDEYNKSLEQLRESGKLPTPQAIVDSVREDKRIDLISMIEEQSKQDTVLQGAVEATEEITTSEMIEKMENLTLSTEIDAKTKETEIE